MKITFDTDARIAGIGLVPWTRLGPEQWFSDYKIASLYDWDLGHVAGAPDVMALSSKTYGMPELAKLRSQNLVDSREFQAMAKEHFGGYNFISYKPVVAPQRLLDTGCRFLSMNQALTTTLENKAAFREDFADLDLPFPPYQIFERLDLQSGKMRAADILNGRETVILQDETLGGGRGTFVVSDQASLASALNAIEHLGGGHRVVVSERIIGASERSVQCCATRYGTFVGPLQKQIIGHPLLANLEVPDGDKFCGAEISADDPLQPAYAEIKSYALKIGERLHKLGYGGIFSVDCLVDKAGKVYVLEINPRLTGITPLVTMLYREGYDIPFYLLHILETASLPYEITDDFIDPNPPEGSLLVLHAQANERTCIVDAPASGAYDLKTLTYERAQYRLAANAGADSLLVQRYTPPGFMIKPGGRLMTMFTKGRVLDDQDRLRPAITKAAETFLDRIALKKVVL